jgi:hypothetical protein
MPATSQEPPGRFASQSEFQTGGSGRRKEGVGETSGQTAVPLFSIEFALAKAGRQKKEVFFIGADPKVRNFIGAPCPLRFGPDVFADALVPQAGALSSPAVLIPKNLKTPVSNPPGLIPGCVVAMVIALPNLRVNRIPRTPR